ncbi:hypothetical protein KL86CLO1_10124 [uncultured Eubacteriales bacterium]|uniref:Uncharacterized protein n=1 Tax=uncultured Eubacteriales bacterium TaxID=172733 RepID=A0A212IWC5_9FIRM|nr:hypothetical protein KL86CLO1_10124 [uncultured Eubacteriales bacterium]
MYTKLENVCICIFLKGMNRFAAHILTGATNTQIAVVHTGPWQFAVLRRGSEKKIALERGGGAHEEEKYR